MLWQRQSPVPFSPSERVEIPLLITRILGIDNFNPLGRVNGILATSPPITQTRRLDLRCFLRQLLTIMSAAARVRAAADGNGGGALPGESGAVAGFAVGLRAFYVVAPAFHFVDDVRDVAG